MYSNISIHIWIEVETYDKYELVSTIISFNKLFVRNSVYSNIFTYVKS